MARRFALRPFQSKGRQGTRGRLREGKGKKADFLQMGERERYEAVRSCMYLRIYIVNDRVSIAYFIYRSPVDT
jgi:hypothetical protein